MNNAVILAPKRSGSTFLQESLNSHPQIVCYDEMFMQNKNIDKRRGQFLYRAMKIDKGWNIEQYLEWLFNKEKDKSTLFRLMYPHDQKFNVIDKIMNMNIPIIHLTRENLLEKELSRASKGKEMGEKIKVDLNKTLSQMEKEQKSNDNYKKKLKNYKKVLHVTYENMIGETVGEQEKIKNYGAFNIVSNQITYLNENINEKICNLLNVDNYSMWSNVSKRNPWNIEDIVSNYDKLIEVIKKSNFSNMINKR